MSWLWVAVSSARPPHCFSLKTESGFAFAKKAESRESNPLATGVGCVRWAVIRRKCRLPSKVLKLGVPSSRSYGVETGYRETGIVYAARTKREIGNIEAWAETGKTNGLRQEILAPNQIETMLPGIAPGFILGLHTASDGRAEPTMATQAIAQVAKNKGTLVLSECAVRGVDLSGGRGFSRGYGKGRY